VAALANERIEILRSEICPAISSGAESRGAFTVAWQVEPEGARARRLTVLVTSAGARVLRVDTVATVHVCS
jgi:hypothetical protein